MIPIKVEIEVRDPEQMGGFTLNRSRLNHPTSKLRPPLEDEFQLNAHQLGPVSAAPDPDNPSFGSGRLGPLPEPLVWFDLASWATSVATREGNRGDHPAWPVEPGSADVILEGAPDLQELGVRHGTRFRVSAEPERFNKPLGFHAVVWAGWVTDWQTTYDKRTRATTTRLQAEDLAAKLGNVTRYGVRHSGTQTLRDRFLALMSSVPVPATLTPDSHGEDAALAQTAMETNLLAHMQMAATSAKHVLRIGAADAYIAYQPRSYRRRLTLFDDRSRFTQSAHGGYFDVTVAIDEPTTVLEVTTHEIGPDGNAADTTTTVANPTTAAVFGRQSTTVDLTIPANRAADVGAWLLPAYNHQLTVTEVELPGGQAYGLTEWIGPLDEARVYVDGAVYQTRILSAAHSWFVNGDGDIEHRTTFQTGHVRYS